MWALRMCCETNKCSLVTVFFVLLFVCLNLHNLVETAEATSNSLKIIGEATSNKSHKNSKYKSPKDLYHVNRKLIKI